MRDARTEFVGSGEEAVAQAGILLLVANLLEDIGQQVFRFLIGGFGVDELVQDFLGKQVLALAVELSAAGKNLLGAAHHFDV